MRQRITLATSQGPQLPQNVMMNREICVNNAALRRPIIRGINSFQIYSFGLASLGSALLHRELWLSVMHVTDRAVAIVKDRKY